MGVARCNHSYTSPQFASIHSLYPLAIMKADIAYTFFGEIVVNFYITTSIPIVLDESYMINWTNEKWSRHLVWTAFSDYRLQVGEVCRSNIDYRMQDRKLAEISCMETYWTRFIDRQMCGIVFMDPGIERLFFVSIPRNCWQKYSAG